MLDDDGSAAERKEEQSEEEVKLAGRTLEARGGRRRRTEVRAEQRFHLATRDFRERRTGDFSIYYLLGSHLKMKEKKSR